MKARRMVRDVLGAISNNPELTRADADWGAFANVTLKKCPLIWQLIWNAPDRMRREMVLMFHFWSQWHRYQFPVFRPTEDLLAGLLLTDSSSVQINDAPPPFPAYMVELPRGFWEFSTAGMYGAPVKESMAPVSSLLMHAFVSPKGGRLGQNLQTIPRGGRFWGCACSSLGHTMHTLSDLPSSGEPFSEWFAEELPSPDAITNKEGSMLAAIKRLWVNLNIYISENGKGSLATGRQRNFRASRQPRSAKKPTVWIIGKEIRIEKDVRHAAQSLDASQGKAGWRVKVRIVVRGHFRNQACGPGRLQRKRIWISPHVRGPSDGHRISHLYTDEGSCRS